MRLSISFFDQILGKRESQVFNFAGIQFRDFVVLKLYVGTKFRENGQKSRKSQNLIPTKFNTSKVLSPDDNLYSMESDRQANHGSKPVFLPCNRRLISRLLLTTIIMFIIHL